MYKCTYVHISTRATQVMYKRFDYVLRLPRPRNLRRRWRRMTAMTTTTTTTKCTYFCDVAWARKCMRVFCSDGKERIAGWSKRLITWLIILPIHLRCLILHIHTGRSYAACVWILPCGFCHLRFNVCILAVIRLQNMREEIVYVHRNWWFFSVGFFVVGCCIEVLGFFLLFI